MAAVSGLRARESPSGWVREYWGANVERSLSKVVGEWLGRKEERWSGPGGLEVRTCWIFLLPERCSRMEGHLMAAERSRWWRPAQWEGEVYSLGA